MPSRLRPATPMPDHDTPPAASPAGVRRTLLKVLAVQAVALAVLAFLQLFYGS